MERVYSGREYIGGIRKSKKCNGKDRRIREGKIWGKNIKNKTEERKRDKVKSRGGRVQERGIAREIYGKVVIWVGW